MSNSATPLLVSAEEASTVTGAPKDWLVSMAAEGLLPAIIVSESSTLFHLDNLVKAIGNLAGTMESIEKKRKARQRKATEAESYKQYQEKKKIDDAAVMAKVEQVTPLGYEFLEMHRYSELNDVLEDVNARYQSLYECVVTTGFIADDGKVMASAHHFLVFGKKRDFPLPLGQKCTRCKGRGFIRANGQALPPAEFRPRNLTADEAAAALHNGQSITISKPR